MSIPRAFGFIPPLPNAGSPHQTPASLMIDNRYAQLQLVERWSWERYVRLCQFLRFTPYEVASLVMLRHDVVETFKRNGRLSGSGHRAVALLLTLLEARVMAAWTDDVIANPFPNLNAAPESPDLSVTEHLREQLPVAHADHGRPETSKSSPAGCGSNGG